MFKIALIILINIQLGYSQITVKGKILNQTDKKPIAYANVGIPNTGIGTISNEDGSFSLQLSKLNLKDTLRFSGIGFSKRAIPIQSLLDKEVIVYLKEQVTQLNEVIVQAKKEKNKTFVLGNRKSRGGTLETDTVYAGSATALLIENKNPIQKGLSFPVYLQSASIRIFRNNLPSFKMRVRLYSVDPLTKGPGEDFLNKSVVVESTMRNGWLTFNLSEFNYLISEPFFVAFESILTKTDRELIAKGYHDFIQKHPNRLRIDTVLFEGKKQVRQQLGMSGIDLPGTFIGIAPGESASKLFSCYTRNTSFDKWEKVRGILAATVTVSNQLPASETISTKAPEPCQESSAVCVAIQACNDFLDESNVNGLQLCISVNGKIKLSKGFGLADVENNLPVSTDTQFRLNSISKSVTSAALIKLVSENKLDLDAPIQKYVPSFPVKKYPFTSRQLAGHLAGIRDYNEKDLSDLVRQEHYENATQATKIFENDSLLFKPGSQFHYSTFGWNLIGAVIEGASGKSYLDYMQESIWKPMGMLNTCGDDNTKSIPSRSKFYDAAGNENDYGDWSYKYAGGGLLSTAEDLVKFGNEVLHSNVLDPKLVKHLFEPQFTSSGKATGYGLGWYVGKDKNGHRIWYHAGDMLSSSSYLIIYPDDDIVIAFLANSQEGTLFDVQKIGSLFYRK
ncbi:MAG: serine hydrolase [Cyclobacteriaceae bacterium]|jgi:serine beta-lactamase-like protein LACTB